MRDIDIFVPDPAGAWRGDVVHDDGGGSGWSAETCRLEAEAFILETKSGDPQEILRTLLADMTAEMRQQFDLFRKLRTAAEVLAEGEDETAAKLARADIKAAVDGMALIIRTLEKIDTLQRQMARDRELESERDAETSGYDDAKQRLFAIIEQRVAERVESILAARERDKPSPASLGEDAAATDRGG